MLATSRNPPASEQTLCAVCLAKRAGTRVPKRKCTCKSGETATRNRAPEGRWQEICSRDMILCMFPVHHPGEEMGDEEFEDILELAHETGQVDGVQHGGFMQARESGGLRAH